MMTAVPGRRSVPLLGFFALGLLGLACRAPLELLGGPTATPTHTATPTLTPTPTPTPTPLPEVRVQEGDRALFYGDWDRAIQEFQTALDQAGTAETRDAALYGLGAALLQAGRAEEAVSVLDELLAEPPADLRHTRGYFLRARAHEAAGRLEAALADYERYLQARPGRIDSYVLERMGDLLRQAGRPLEAVERYEAAAAAPRLGSALGIRLKVGRAYFEAGDYAAALEAFDQVYAVAQDAATKATANLLAGRTLEALGRQEEAHQRYLDSVLNFPTVYDSYLGLIDLVEAGVPVDEFQRGLVDYYAGAYEPALAAFNRYLAVNLDPAGFYFRGLTRRALGDYEGALSDFSQTIASGLEAAHWADAWLDKALTEWAYLDRYAEAVQTYLDFVAAAPAHPSAPQALFAAGRTAERSGDLARAAEIWLRLPEEYPGTPLGFQGAFEAGVVLYRLGRYDEAVEAFEKARAAALDTSQQAGSLLWAGKSHLAAGREDQAHLAWREAAATDPTGYYAIRAEDLLAGRPPFASRGVANFTTDPEAERAEAEAWLRATFGIQAEGPLSQLDETLATDPRMIRGEEFWRLGLYEEARAEFESLREDYSQDPLATYRLMHRYLDLGLYRSAILAARQILRLAGMDDAATMEAPVYFNHIRFAPYFGDLILPEAAAYGFDGLFLLSVVRQESLFEGFATSFAAARGLMQIIPSTGRSIAEQLGWPPNYTDDDLYRPIVSVRFGTYYLAAQRDRFDGDLYAALAAYNAGPGNALIWKELAPEDPDLFLEVIRIPQTHRYIQTIYEVFTIYQRLYVSDGVGRQR